jgi:hypothetical protein
MDQVRSLRTLSSQGETSITRVGSVCERRGRAEARFGRAEGDGGMPPRLAGSRRGRPPAGWRAAASGRPARCPGARPAARRRPGRLRGRPRAGCPQLDIFVVRKLGAAGNASSRLVHGAAAAEQEDSVAVSAPLPAVVRASARNRSQGSHRSRR